MKESINAGSLIINVLLVVLAVISFQACGELWSKQDAQYEYVKSVTGYDDSQDEVVKIDGEWRVVRTIDTPPAKDST